MINDEDDKILKVSSEVKVTLSSNDSVWVPEINYKDSLRASSSMVESEYDIGFEEEEKELNNS